MNLATRLICLTFLLFFGSLVHAQGPDPADPTTSPIEWYTSVGGVGIATIFLVSMAKRALVNVAYVSKVPTWVYAVAFSLLLTYLCVYVFGTLPGDFWQLAWQAVYNAAIATGIYEWTENKDTTLQESAVTAGVITRRRSSK